MMTPTSMARGLLKIVGAAGAVTLLAMTGCSDPSRFGERETGDYRISSDRDERDDRFADRGARRDEPPLGFGRNEPIEPTSRRGSSLNDPFDDFFFSGGTGYPRRYADREEFPRDPWDVEDCDDCEAADAYPDQRVVCVVPRRGSQRYCMPREQAARLYSNGARYWLLRGDAELTTVDIDCDEERGGLFPQTCRLPTRPSIVSGYNEVGFDQPIDRAMEYWDYAAAWGRAFGAQAALLAQRRRQAHMVQCESDAASLRRISRVGPGGVGDVISLKLRQRALQALGYYAFEVDGAYGPNTRGAVRDFQRELGYDETGSLTPRQTTLLVCHAAQTARDPRLQNALGIMYSTGLGVKQNTDLSLEWFETAARRNDPDAHFNLAIIYGTGAVLGSYRLCGLIENPERADAYLRDAASLGHPMATRWRRSGEFRRFASAEARWVAIGHRLVESAMQRESEFFLEWTDRINLAAIQNLQPGCLAPNSGPGGTDARGG